MTDAKDAGREEASIGTLPITLAADERMGSPPLHGPTDVTPETLRLGMKLSWGRTPAALPELTRERA